MSLRRKTTSHTRRRSLLEKIERGEKTTQPSRNPELELSQPQHSEDSIGETGLEGSTKETAFRRTPGETGKRGTPGETGLGLGVEDLTVSYQRIPAVHHVSFRVGPGCCVALVGPNGAGKTTLLKAIGGLLPLETGRVVLPGGRGRSRVPAYVPQREHVDWDFPITVRGLVEMGRYPALGAWGFFGSKDRGIVQESLRMMNLEELADRQIKKLSGGQQQRAFLARAWAQQSGVYLLDEPFNGLDANARKSFREALHKLREAGRIVLASHHDLEEVPEIFDHVVILNGEAIAAGPVGEVFTAENLARAYETGVYSGEKTGR